MTANRIKAAALSRFARYGYKGTSLADIAQDVGIKKPSIYAHFKGKEELYLICLEETLQKDLAFLHAYISQPYESCFSLLYALLKSYGERFHESAEAMFWLRSSFFPPDELRATVVAKANEYIDSMGTMLRPIFQEAKAANVLHVEAEEALDAYLCLFDGLMIELMYAGSANFKKRFQSSWKVFQRGLQG
ncbi:TetR/AcrR family transcriptional regulator [Ectobacillus panaciterrae]|uniref:TetR/AcrR family transcriptional regulator n=1 Tax=Ectobacillus panaciterrae TaxID=363872 RepID=UPI0003F50F11|nr:TetR/AcrR family transcriptional regulator [Ectobacillus panaciterrae]